MTETQSSADPAAQAGSESEGAARQKLSLKVTITSPSACLRHVTVVVPREDIDRYFDRAIGELMPSAQVPGFRPGRAPRRLVQSRFRDELRDQVKGVLLLDSMAQISKDSQFASISEPEFDFEAIELPDEGPMKFEFDVEVRPEFDLPEWRGLSLNRPVREVLERDVDLQLEKILDEHGTLVPYDGPAELNDYVVVNMRFLKDGEEISRLDEQTIRVKPVLSFPDGSLPNFGDLMRGARAGDHRETHIDVVSDAAVRELQGQRLQVTIDVLDVKQVELPAVDEQVLSRLGFASEQKLRDAVRTQFERQLQYFQQRNLRAQITEKLVRGANWDLPAELLRRQSSRELNRQMLELQSSGFDEEYILARENEMRRDVMASTERALKEHFILEKIAETESIEPSERDYDLEYARIAAQSGESVRRARARIEKRGLTDVVRNQITERMVVARILEHATIRDVASELGANEEVAVNHSLCGAVAREIPEAKYSDNKPTTLPSPTDRS